MAAPVMGRPDVERPMDITMSRVRLASDTCDIYFTYIKVNHLLYTCSLGPLEDGILLGTSPVCMHRYCRSFTDVEEECKRQGTTTPSAREAWKQRRKKMENSSQSPNIRPRQPRHLAVPEPPDIRPPAQKFGPSEPESNKCHHCSPDIRHRLKARISGPTSPDIRPPLSAHSEGPRPMYPFSP